MKLQEHALPPDLSRVILAIAEARGPDQVLGSILTAILEQPGVAMTWVWFMDTGENCPICHRLGAADTERALHLRASGGRSLDPAADWTRVDGGFHRIPLDGGLKISHMARTGESVLIPDLEQGLAWVRDPDWVRRERLAGFVGHPLVFRGHVVGVLAAFFRVQPDESSLDWLSTFAAHAAVAIGNCRAFEEIERLRQQLELERDYLLEQVHDTGSFGEILGVSPALERVLQQVQLVAATEANVLLQGESGCGKELIAQAIHQRSRRSQKPMVRVNCGSIPHDLFESEFFGHAKGAFTGAVRDRVGRFQLADGGTLFLDEVGEIPPDLQAKLLRVLQEGEFERVGEDATRRVNVRLIAATNRHLKEEVAQGRFRLDLYYRLGVFPLEVPPLRERREDIPLLAAHFVQQACARLHLPAPRLPQREVQKLQRYDWPGNVRELQNVMERAVILSRGGAIEIALGEPRRVENVKEDPGGARYVTQAEWSGKEKRNLLAALQAAGGKVSGPGGAAELLGMNPNTLASKMRKLGLRRAFGG